MNDNTSHKSAYGGRSLWQWILIYVVVGGLVYAAVYYFMAQRSGNSGYSGPTKASVQTAAPAGSPAQAPAQTPMQQSGGTYNW